jgi:uncharacterized LabA/DUF88 family protein
LDSVNLVRESDLSDLPPLPESRESSLAILIDAENTPHGLIGEIMDASARFGRAIIRRAYGDWGTSELVPWREVFKEYPISAIQQFHYVSGKNSSDSAMMIDAMDILKDKRPDTFVLVTSDSDFTKLATRIREDGLRVIGMGRSTAPKSFVKACDEFIFLETLASPAPLSRSKRESRSGTNQKAIRPTSLREGTAGGRDLLLRAAATASADANGIIRGAELGVILRRLDPSFNPRTFGVTKLADFVALYPDILIATGEKTGGFDPTYKLVDSQAKSSLNESSRTNV